MSTYDWCPIYVTTLKKIQRHVLFIERASRRVHVYRLFLTENIQTNICRQIEMSGDIAVLVANKTERTQFLTDLDFVI